MAAEGSIAIVNGPEGLRAASSFRDAWARLVRNPRVVVGGALAVLICGSAVIAPLLTHYDPLTQVLVSRLKPPMWVVGGASSHPLGTDSFGRDTLSRILYGARYSLGISLAAVAVSGVLGVTLGIVAGYRGGYVETIVMRLADAQLALPAILIAIMVVAVYGDTVANLIIVLAISGWSTYTRILFGVVSGIREREYIVAASCLGSSTAETLWYHVLPNCLSPIIVISTLQMGRMLLLEAGLSFLGLGVPDPLPAWGAMLAEGERNIFADTWLTTLPGLAITVTVFAANLLGDGLRRAFDPHA